MKAGKNVGAAFGVNAVAGPISKVLGPKFNTFVGAGSSIVQGLTTDLLTTGKISTENLFANMIAGGISGAAGNLKSLKGLAVMIGQAPWLDIFGFQSGSPQEPLPPTNPTPMPTYSATPTGTATPSPTIVPNSNTPTTTPTIPYPILSTSTQIPTETATPVKIPSATETATPIPTAMPTYPATPTGTATSNPTTMPDSGVSTPIPTVPYPVVTSGWGKPKSTSMPKDEETTAKVKRR